MAAGRQRRRARASGSRRRPRDTGEHVQLRRNKVQCSNHDATHTLILSPDGKLTELWATASANCAKTRLVKELENHDIVQIACGDRHAMALSRGGELFTWGQNTHGQLGVGSQSTLIQQPQLVTVLKGIALAQVAAGGAHSTAVSLSGAVYTWGKNDFGQLGLGDTEDRDCPSRVGALEHWKTVFISCGADHTAVLSKEGMVCTFGAGRAGQLGHNSTQNELKPRVVAELWGARVSQVACGRQHTLVYVPSLDKVYSFGSIEGQVGDERTPNQLIPLPMNLPVKGGKSSYENNRTQKVIVIIAGGKESIVLCKKSKDSCLNGIATLTDKEVDAWISNSSSKHWESIKKNIRLIFSSEACINGSFLEESRDKHFRTSKGVSGINMSKVQRFYERISKKPKVFQEVQKEIEKFLPSLSSSLISPENFRVYLILPFVLQGEDDSSSRSLTLLAQAITKLQPKDLQTLECLWANLQTCFFEKLVVLYQRVSQKNLTKVITEMADGQRNPCDLYPHETVTLQILQILYQVNSRSGFRVQENNFYVPEAKDIISLFWFAGVEEVALQKLTKYVCIFDMQGKIDIHNSERHTLFISTMGWEPWDFPVRRQYLLQDIWAHLNNAPTQQFTKTLKVLPFLRRIAVLFAQHPDHFDCIVSISPRDTEVTFIGEAGMDEGGLAQELFSVAARTLCHPSTGAFRRAASGLAWFPSQTPNGEDTFFQIGTLCGMALYSERLAPFPFPRALYKKLLDLPPTLEDLQELYPAAGRSLQRILDEECDDMLESLDMNFTIMEEGDSMVTVELTKNGASIPVTRDNRKEYVDLYVNYVFNESIQKPFEDFMQGFLRGCPTRKWKMFLPVELQIILEGHKKFDWHLLEKNARYCLYKKSDQTIRNFWAVFHKLPEEKKKMFLAFMSGSEQVPVYGLEEFKFCIADPETENPDEACLSANTCSHILLLPRYSSKRILKKKLLYAMEHNEGFGLS